MKPAGSLLLAGLVTIAPSCTAPAPAPQPAAAQNPLKTTPAEKKKPAKKSPETPPQKTPDPEFKKPVRMNGRGEISSISLEDFFNAQQSGTALIYDARPGFFHSIGRVPGALSLPAKNCDPLIHAKEAEIKAALKSGKTIIVYCTNLFCKDARTLASHLSGFGYPVRIFHGGWEKWKEAGMPVEP